MDRRPLSHCLRIRRLGRAYGGRLFGGIRFCHLLKQRRRARTLRLQPRTTHRQPGTELSCRGPGCAGALHNETHAATTSGARAGRTYRDARQKVLHAAVDNRVREDLDLDFKEAPYGRGDADKHSLAADVAAMGNTVGGVIIIGIPDEEAIAVEATPVGLSEDEELRMYQVVANLVTPAPAFSIRRVETVDETRATSCSPFLSAAAPHAVRVNQNLRYPRRYGTTTAYMSESDVADAYRNRFAAAAGQVERVRVIHVKASLALTSRKSCGGRSPWSRRSRASSGSGSPC